MKVLLLEGRFLKYLIGKGLLKDQIIPKKYQYKENSFSNQNQRRLVGYVKRRSL